MQKRTVLDEQKDQYGQSAGAQGERTQGWMARNRSDHRGLENKLKVSIFILRTMGSYLGEFQAEE